jgi:hypothetical protein
MFQIPLQVSTKELAGLCAFCVIVIEKAHNLIERVRGGKNGDAKVAQIRAGFKEDFRAVLIERGICTTLEDIRDAVKELVVLERNKH